MMATVLSGLSCVVVGCGEGEAPSPNVGDAKSVEPNGAAAASTIEGDSNAPPKLDLVEPTPALEQVPAVRLTPADDPGPADEPSPTVQLTIGDAAPPISIAKWIQGEPIEAFTSDKVFVVEIGRAHV